MRPFLIYRSRKANKFICLLFSILFILCLLASFILDQATCLIIASIMGAFALVYGVLWFIWAGEEKRKGQTIKDCLERGGVPGSFDPAMSYEFLLPVKDLKKAAFKRISNCVKWSFIISFILSILIAASLALDNSLNNAVQTVSILLFCLFLTVPGNVVQWVIYKMYVRHLPYRITLYPGWLIVGEDRISARQIRDMRISPVRVYNPNSPGVFRALTVCTDKGKRTYTIDFRAIGSKIRWKEYEQLANTLYHWGNANNVPVTFAYMD